MDLSLLKPTYDEIKAHLAEDPESMSGQRELTMMHATYDLHRIANAVEKMAGIKSVSLDAAMENIVPDFEG